MDSKFDGMTINFGGFYVKFVFPPALRQANRRPGVNGDGDTHFHYENEIHFILDGNCSLSTEQGEFLLARGCVCIIPRGVTHDRVIISGGGTVFNTLLSLRSAGAVKSEVNRGLKRKVAVWENVKKVLVFEDCERECDYIRDLMQNSKSDGAGLEYIKQSVMTLVLFSLTDRLEQMFPRRSKLAQTCKIHYDGTYLDAELENYLMTGYRRKLPREEVASHIGISTAQLSRIIKKNYSMTYNELITALRMNKAKQLIGKDTVLATLAKSLGYTTYNGFAAAFWRYFGMSPEQMREEKGKLK